MLGRNAPVTILDFFRRWRKKRAKAAIERAQFERTVEDFVLDTKPLVPTAPKYPEAALYRYAWKRARRTRAYLRGSIR